MASTLSEEFILALDEEIEAIKKGEGGSIVKVFNGRFLREVAGMFVYAFNLENFLAVLDDTPAEIEIGRTKYSAQILLTQGTDVEIGIDQFCGKFIPEANLHTNLWYLLELLKKKFVENKYGSGAINFSLSDKIFLGEELSPAPTSQTPLKYSQSKRPLNEMQKQAITKSFSSRFCVIWGPPGTGKTTTIAATIEAHLNAGRRVLLVSHANNAVDEALEDVAEHLKPTPFYQEGKLVRLGIPQNYHLVRMKNDFPLVLLEGIAAKLGESLSKEKDLLEAKKKQIDDQLVQYQTTLRTIQQVEALKSELPALGQARAECDSQRNSVRVELERFQEIQNKNKERLNESHNAGAIKRFLKGLNPVEIQRSIDKTSISIDSKLRMLAEIDVRFLNIKQLYEKKEIEIKTVQIEVNTFFRKTGIPESKLVATTKELEKQKDIVLARISEINRQLDEIQKKILSEAKLIATTLTKTFSAKEFPDQPFDILILDEASMAPLPHLYWATGRCREFATIVGDFLQLPPICISKGLMARKWLGRSIFEVLGIQSVEGACADPRVKLLDTQYRMAPEISEICNRLFYQYKLKDDPSTFGQMFDDGVSKSPLVLVETKKMNPWCSRLSAGSRFNLYDALVCATLAKRLIPAIESIRKDPESPSAKIGIMTPYAPQARLITKIAEDWKLLDFVRISTVHKFQGGEEPIIIFDSVEGTGTRIASMLDDGLKDSDASLLLNVAISRAKRKLYLVANTNYLISELHPDSSLTRITNHFLQKAGMVESESLVDNYFTSDFEKWADLLLTTTTPKREPVSGDPYTEKNFWAQFIQDLKSAKKRVIIHSPFLAVRRINKFMDYFRSMVDKGIEIRIHTWPSNRQYGNMVEQSEIAIDSFRKIGAKVIEAYDSKKKHFKTAIIDDNILWDGSLNILSHGDTEEHMWRYEGVTAVEEIVRNLELDGENTAGEISDEKCPKCGKPMIVRRSKYGAFLGCSTYPKSKCDGKMDISKSKMASKQRACPDCGKPMIIRRSAKGAFLACTGYPVCKKTLRL